MYISLNLSPTRLVFNFFALFTKNCFNLNRKKDNIMKSKAFWGGKNRDNTASLKNEVNFLAAQCVI